MKWISLRFGTFSIMQGSSVRRVAAKMGRQAFLAPPTVISPRKGVPPLICKASMII